jgi:hypothetical protein
MRTWTFAGALILLLLVPLLYIDVAPDAEGPVAVIANPFGQRGALDVIAAADGDVLRTSKWSWLAIAATHSERGFRARLIAAGALLLVAPGALGACFNDSQSHDEPAYGS